jgi:CRP-like cAMP-binding protein
MSEAIQNVEVSPLEQLRTLRRLFVTPFDVSTTALAALAAHVRAVRIRAGTRLVEADQPVTTVYLVLEGELASAYNDRIVYTFGPTDAMGILPALARKRSGFAAWATEDTLALSWRVEDMLEVFEDHFELLHAVLRGLAQEGIELRKQLPPHGGFSNDLRTHFDCDTRRLDLVERILCLRHTFGLESSHIDELAELARAAGEVRHPAGAKLWSSGDASDSILIIMRGTLHGQSPEGIRFRIGPGDIAGGLGTVAELPRWYDATAGEPIIALTLSREVLVDLLEDQPDLGFDFLHLMAAMLLDLRLRVAVYRESRGGSGPYPVASFSSGLAAPSGNQA